MQEPVWADIDHVPIERRKHQQLERPDLALKGTTRILKKIDGEIHDEHERRQRHMAAGLEALALTPLAFPQSNGRTRVAFSTTPIWDRHRPSQWLAGIASCPIRYRERPADTAATLLSLARSKNAFSETGALSMLATKLDPAHRKQLHATQPQRLADSLPTLLPAQT